MVSITRNNKKYRSSFADGPEKVLRKHNLPLVDSNGEIINMVRVNRL